MSRVVMFVYNDCKRDQRVLREAETLAKAGHTVTIMARPTDVQATVGEREQRDGFEIIRVPVPWDLRRRWMYIRSPWRLRRRFASAFLYGLKTPPRGWAVAAVVAAMAVLASPWIALRVLTHLAWRAWRRARGLPTTTGTDTIDWLVTWRWVIVRWARRAAAEAPAADVWHGHDLSGLPGAVEGRRLHGGTVVYDSHEYFVESGSNARRPAWGKWFLERLERGESSVASALITVNRTLAEILSKKYGFRRVVVLHNTPERWSPPVQQPDLLRQAAGIPKEAPVVLYHGGFSGDRGLLPLAEAMLAPGLEGAHLVYLGFGDLWDRLVALAAEPRFGGRLHVLPAVEPSELLSWVASADVGVMPNQPVTANERLSTPNKLFESLSAGIPVVVSDFPERRRIVLEDPDGPLGAACDPTDPMAIGEAIRSIVTLEGAARADLRRRCLKAAHERWNWESESRRLVELYAELTAAP